MSQVQHHGRHISTGRENTHVRRSEASSLCLPLPSTTSPTFVVTFIHYRGMHNLAMLPDTGADEIIIGPQHLNAMGLSTNDLKPPPDLPRFTADWSAMKPAHGSYRAELQVKARKITTLIDVHHGTLVPLLSYKACRNLASSTHLCKVPSTYIRGDTRAHVSMRVYTGQQDCTSPVFTFLTMRCSQTRVAATCFTVFYLGPVTPVQQHHNPYTSQRVPLEGVQ